jgi:hypothetical protein
MAGAPYRQAGSAAGAVPDVALERHHRTMFRRKPSRRQEIQRPQSMSFASDDLLHKRLVALEAVSARHSAHITIMWQAPSLGLAAEALLLTIALAPGSSTTSRVVVSVLGVAVAALVSQFMAKHRHASLRDGLILQELVKKLDLDELFSVADGVKSTWLVSRSSYRSWRIGLGVFLLLNVGILVTSIAYPEALAGSAVCPTP